MSGNNISAQSSFNDAFSLNSNPSTTVARAKVVPNETASSCVTRMMDDGCAADALFERLKLVQGRSPDMVEVLRSVTAKINSRLMSHDRMIRQNTLEKLWAKNTNTMQILLQFLDQLIAALPPLLPDPASRQQPRNSKDLAVSTYIASVLRETLCLKQGKGKKCRVNNQSRLNCATHLISISGTQILTRCIVQTNAKRDGNVNTEILLQDLIWALSTLAPRDPKFANKVRMLGAVRVIHFITKSHFSDNKIIFPLLVIMKQLSKNPVTTSILVRDGVVTTYERVLVSLGYIPTARLRLCLDAIDYFSRNKVYCMHMVKTGLCLAVMRVFDRWDRYEGRTRLKMCAHILQALQHLCALKAGRRALCTKKHVTSLHRFCTNCPDDPDFDKLLARVCMVITLCLKHQCLPVPVTNPATFALPIQKDSRLSWPYSNDDDDDYGGGSDSKFAFSDNEDDTQDTDIDTDTELRRSEYNSADLSNSLSISPEDIEKKYAQTGDSLNSWIRPFERDFEDLKRYSGFFRELKNSKQTIVPRSRANIGGSMIEDFMTCLNKTSLKSQKPMMVFSNSSYRSGNEKSPTRETTSSETIISPTSSRSSLKMLKDLSSQGNFSSSYCMIATKVRSVIPFVKVAYPDMKGGNSLCIPEPLHNLDRTACRAKLLNCVERAINPDGFMSDTIYDIDALIASEPPSTTRFLTNTDEIEVSKSTSTTGKLEFESRFESGNLRKVIQIAPSEYELILMPDVNSNKRHQWFYFEVRKMQSGKPYTFNIVNCEKSESQFNFGMQPVMYSVKEATLGRPGWVRAGSDICYYRNSYHYTGQKNHNKCYLTVTFTLLFPHPNDICYIAYHFPYTYSMLMTRIWTYHKSQAPNVHFRAEPLCYTLNNNELPVLTITAEDSLTNPISDREVVFLTARVHPGESNASWVMEGTLEHLLSVETSAKNLREKYVFKLVPMLNVEGVINGCHRCGLTNEDLNRRWSRPSPILHPTIFHTKGLIEYLVRVHKKPPMVYCDYHGHSRKKNVFFYGCASSESWCAGDKLLPDQPLNYLMLPALMHRSSPAFALSSCSFRVERERESTARVTLWRHLGISRSYTMEASFCGFDQGPYKGFHLNTNHLQRVGADFCEALNSISDNNTIDIQITKDLQGSKTVDSDGGSNSDSILKTDSDEEFD